MNVILNFTILFLIFAGIHSLLATDYIKKKVKKKLKNIFKFYRLIYTLISIITFTPILYIWIKYTSLTSLVYSIPLIVTVLIQIPAFILLIYALYQTDIFEFIGLKSLKKTDKLITNGAYGIVRHPLYTSAIALLFSKTNMTMLDLTAALLFSTYFIIGAFIEEKRLISVFKNEYRNYQKNVSMFIPSFCLKRKCRKNP